MKQRFLAAVGLVLSLALTTPGKCQSMTGLWRFDIVSPGGLSLGAMTIQSRQAVQRQADDQMRWAKAKGEGTDVAPARPASRDVIVEGYTGILVTNQGGHALPIESIDVADGRMTMVVGSPRGLVIFRGTIDPAQDSFDGLVTYHNGQVYRMRGVKLTAPLPPPSKR